MIGQYRCFTKFKYLLFLNNVLKLLLEIQRFKRKHGEIWVIVKSKLDVYYAQSNLFTFTLHDVVRMESCIKFPSNCLRCQRQPTPGFA